MTDNARGVGSALEEMGTCPSLLLISCIHDVGESVDSSWVPALPAFIPLVTSSILKADNSQVYNSRLMYFYKAENLGVEVGVGGDPHRGLVFRFRSVQIVSLVFYPPLSPLDSRK